MELSLWSPDLRRSFSPIFELMLSPRILFLLRWPSWSWMRASRGLTTTVTRPSAIMAGSWNTRDFPEPVGIEQKTSVVLKRPMSISKTCQKSGVFYIGANARTQVDGFEHVLTISVIKTTLNKTAQVNGLLGSTSQRQHLRHPGSSFFSLIR